MAVTIKTGQFIETRPVDPTVGTGNNQQIIVGGNPVDLYIIEVSWWNPLTGLPESAVEDGDGNLMAQLPDRYTIEHLERLVIDLLYQGMQCRAEHSEGR